MTDRNDHVTRYEYSGQGKEWWLSVGLWQGEAGLTVWGPSLFAHRRALLCAI